jgi:hypothetical protein
MLLEGRYGHSQPPSEPAAKMGASPYAARTAISAPRTLVEIASASRILHAHGA